MKLSINGELKEIINNNPKIFLSSVIKILQMNPKLIVVEFNGKIINSQNWETQEVHDGDILEIVTIVGGG